MWLRAFSPYTTKSTGIIIWFIALKKTSNYNFSHFFHKNPLYVLKSYFLRHGTNWCGMVEPFNPDIPVGHNRVNTNGAWLINLKLPFQLPYLVGKYFIIYLYELGKWVWVNVHHLHLPVPRPLPRLIILQNLYTFTLLDFFLIFKIKR